MRSDDPRRRSRPSAQPPPRTVATLARRRRAVSARAAAACRSGSRWPARRRCAAACSLWTSTQSERGVGRLQAQALTAPPDAHAAGDARRDRAAAAAATATRRANRARSIARQPAAGHRQAPDRLLGTAGDTDHPHCRSVRCSRRQRGRCSRRRVPLLERIAAALRSERGIAAGDRLHRQSAVPHACAFRRTSSFPPPAPRRCARSLRAIIGDPARVSAEGRADADPIAPNTTPEGREQNRRIEIVLHRQD